MLQPSWVLDDGTQIVLRAVANRDDLSLFAEKQWSARVNGTTVPTDTKALRGSSSESLFKLPDGREAVARVRGIHGARICDLAVGDQIILYPGKQPFTCPACRNAVEPQRLTCVACTAAQPTYEARVLAMQSKGVATSILHMNVFCVLLGASQVFGSHPKLAFASLSSTGVGISHASLVARAAQANSHVLLEHTLTQLAAYMMCVFGCALFALRGPASAAMLNLVAFLYMLSTRVLTPEGSWFALVLAGVMLFASLATAERALEIAHAAKRVRAHGEADNSTRTSTL